ncbi:MAG: thioredoxin [Clostridia bacterium]|nr:thioredoxin [Clostridia bacterium]MCI8866370.1 thioredoxin [Lachnospiraceae bacterium]
MLMEKIFTTENFEMEVLKSDKPVLVDFYADWCGPCKMMAPLIEKMAEEFSDSAVIGKLNVDDNEEIAMKYQVMNIPTLILFKNGAAVNRLVGVQSREILEKLLR